MWCLLCLGAVISHQANAEEAENSKAIAHSFDSNAKRFAQLLSERERFEKQLDAESQIISDLKKSSNSLLGLFTTNQRLKSHKRTHQQISRDLDKLENDIARMRQRTVASAQRYREILENMLAGNPPEQTAQNFLTALKPVQNWLAKYNPSRNPAYDIEQVLRLKVTPLDDSEEILEKMELIKANEEQVKRMLMALDDRYQEIRKEQKIKRISRFNRIGENIFDDSSYSAVVSRETAKEEPNSEAKGEQPPAAEESKPVETVSEEGKTEPSDPEKAGIEGGGVFMPAYRMPDIVNREAPTPKETAAPPEPAATEELLPPAEQTPEPSGLEGRFISSTGVESDFSETIEEPGRVDDLARIKAEKTRYQELLRRLKQKRQSIQKQFDTMQSSEHK
jgi:CRISPR/Cas system CSM-associated protein Csm2 small subunit